MAFSAVHLGDSVAENMFVRLMTADEWHGKKDRGISIDGPTWDQVKQAILALDGRQKTLVTLSHKQGSDTFMIIAGQWDGRFLVNATKDNCDFYSLIDPDRSRKNRHFTSVARMASTRNANASPKHGRWKRLRPFLKLAN